FPPCPPPPPAPPLPAPLPAPPVPPLTTPPVEELMLPLDELSPPLDELSPPVDELMLPLLDEDEIPHCTEHDMVRHLTIAVRAALLLHPGGGDAPRHATHVESAAHACADPQQEASRHALQVGSLDWRPQFMPPLELELVDVLPPHSAEHSVGQ